MSDDKKITISLKIDIDPEMVKNFIVENLNHPTVMKIVSYVAATMANKKKGE